MAFFFSGEGPVEEFGAAEELADAPEAIEMPVVPWHMARCTSAKDLVGAPEDFDGGADDFERGGAILGVGRVGFEDSGCEGIAEELSREGIVGEALGL